MEENNSITYFAQVDRRNQQTSFGIKAIDRTKHVYTIGKTGMGKSTLLENMAVQDIKSGNGMAFMDPHGKTADLLLDYVPEERIEDVIYFAPFDLENPISFNVLENVDNSKRHLVASGLMSAFKKIWVDAWSARMEYILNNILLALLEYPDATLLGVNRMLSDKIYRKKVIANITDSSVKAFWVDEFSKYGERYMQEAGASIQNKIGQFVSNPIVRNIIGQTKSSFDVRDIMDKKKILIINLSKGQVGEDAANLLGSMLITKIYLGAMSRADVSQAELNKLPNFYFFVDEFQSFANESFADILSEARKYKLNLTIAHQYIEQMPDNVRAAVFGNVGTMIIFRLGSFDADIFEKEFSPSFYADDIVNLGFAQIYLRLMIDGIGSVPFSAKTLPPIEMPDISFKSEIIEASRKQFSQPKEKVEKMISDWHEPLNQAPIKKEGYQPSSVETMAVKKVTVGKQDKKIYPSSKSQYQTQSRPQFQSQNRFAGGDKRTEVRNVNKDFNSTNKVENNIKKVPIADRQQLKVALSGILEGMKKETPSFSTLSAKVSTDAKAMADKTVVEKIIASGENKLNSEVLKRSEIELVNKDPKKPEEVSRDILEKTLYVEKPDGFKKEKGDQEANQSI